MVDAARCKALATYAKDERERIFNLSKTFPRGYGATRQAVAGRKL